MCYNVCNEKKKIDLRLRAQTIVPHIVKSRFTEVLEMLQSRLITNVTAAVLTIASLGGAAMPAIANAAPSEAPIERAVNRKIMHAAILYDKDGASSGKMIHAYNRVLTYGKAIEIGGGKYYDIGHGRYVKVGNIDGTDRVLSHNAYIYNNRGRRVQVGQKLYNGTIIRTYGSSFRINGHLMYRIGENQYVKRANFDLTTVGDTTVPVPSVPSTPSQKPENKPTENKDVTKEVTYVDKDGKTVAQGILQKKYAKDGTFQMLTYGVPTGYKITASIETLTTLPDKITVEKVAADSAHQDVNKSVTFVDKDGKTVAQGILQKKYAADGTFTMKVFGVPDGYKVTASTETLTTMPDKLTVEKEAPKNPKKDDNKQEQGNKDNTQTPSKGTDTKTANK